MITEEKLQNAIKEVLLNPTQDIAPELIELVSKLLERVIKTITSCITTDYPIHESICKKNQVYLEFVHNIFPEKTYLQITSFGGLSDSVRGNNQRIANLTLLGLPFLVKSAFGVNYFQVKKKYKEFVEKIDLLMRLYNTAVKENLDFSFLFITSLAFLNISINEYDNQIKEK